jgi:ankyrin repeat protein
MMNAADKSRDRVLRLLLERGIGEVNARNSAAATALHFARVCSTLYLLSSSGLELLIQLNLCPQTTEVATLLLNARAVTNIMNNEGEVNFIIIQSCGDFNHYWLMVLVD